MRKMADLLPVAEFIRMRREGLSFAAIGRQVGAASSSVKKYGARVLPADLLRSYKRRVRRCSRCGLASEPHRPVDGSGLCSWCRMDKAGINLLRYYRG